MGEVPDFVSMRSEFLLEIEKSYNDGNTENIKNKFQLLKAPVAHRRGALEQAMRDKLLRILGGETISGGVRPARRGEGTVDEGGGGDTEATVCGDVIRVNDVGCGDGPCATSLPAASIADKAALERFIGLCVGLCRDEVVTPALSVVLLGDVFDATTLDVCQALFEFVERNVATWKEPLFFATCKNNILRMCNDLLRRLSKSQNTIFCGRILLFLAMFFPFSERSGLNIVSEFNLDNITKYGAESSQQEMDNNTMEEIVPESSIKIDYNFYVKFWSLQDYFRSPNQCYNKVQWKEFVNHSNAVLSVFKNYKVEADPLDIGPTSSLSSSKMEGRHYFAKFLTNQKLLVLQLNDVHFRRTIYLQFLILFQFLNAHVKSKPESYELKPEQADWVKETTELVHRLIRETPPNGEKFMKTVIKILQREEHWNTWKNEGCPALKPVSAKVDGSTSETPATAGTGVPSAKVPPATAAPIDDSDPDAGQTDAASLLSLYERRPLGEALKERTEKDPFIVIQSDGKTKLWNMNSEIEYSMCENRRFVPKLKDYFDEVIQQADPSAMIEQKYKKVSDPMFAWSALRLLRSKSPHFYAVTHNPISKQPDFLEQVCKRISKESYYLGVKQGKAKKRKRPKKFDEFEKFDPIFKLSKEYFSSEVEDEEDDRFVKPAEILARVGGGSTAAAAEVLKAKKELAEEKNRKEAAVAVGGGGDNKGSKVAEAPVERRKVKPDEEKAAAGPKVAPQSDASPKDSKEEPANEEVEEDGADEDEDEEVDDEEEEEVDDDEEDEEDDDEDREGGEAREDEEGGLEPGTKKKRQKDEEPLKVAEDGGEAGSLRKKLKKSHGEENTTEKKEEIKSKDPVVDVEEVIEIDLEKVQDQSLISKILEDVVVEEAKDVNSKPNVDGSLAKTKKTAKEEADVARKSEADKKVQHNGAVTSEKRGDDAGRPAPLKPPQPPPTPHARPAAANKLSRPSQDVRSLEDNKKKSVVPTRKEPPPPKKTEPTKRSSSSSSADVDRGDRKFTEVSDRALERVVKVIGPEWTKLAEKMGYKNSEIKKYMPKGSNSERCKGLLRRVLGKAQTPSVEWFKKYLTSTGFEKAATYL